MNPWISVDEGLPEPNQIVQVWTNWRIGGLPFCSLLLDQAYINVQGDWIIRKVGYSQLSHKSVLFWMPMPVPPPNENYPTLRDGSLELRPLINQIGVAE